MKASEAFDCVCAKISEKYIDSGWRYSKSKHWITKKDKNFIYKIFFYTSWYNVSDKRVSFYGACSIFPLNSKHEIWGITTNECNIPDGELDWNIANQETWDKTIKEFTDWVDEMFIPMVSECTNNLNDYVKKVVSEGFYPPKGYVIDIGFALDYGSRELAEEATKRYYENMKESEKEKFKENYKSMISGGEAVSEYGKNMMINYSNFKTIIENKIIVNL